MAPDGPTDPAATSEHDLAGPYLAPVDRPARASTRLLSWLLARRFATTPTWLRVLGPRMPLSFLAWGARPYRLDSRLLLDPDTATLIRAHVAGLNGCAWCLDAQRWSATTRAPHLLDRLDALGDFPTSPLFDDRERAALAVASELTRERRVDPETFAELRRHYFEREACEVVWVVASENLANLTNLGLGIGSDGLCARGPAGRRARAAAT